MKIQCIVQLRLEHYLGDAHPVSGVASLCHAIRLSDPACIHRAGLRLGEDGKRCVDIDECAEGTAQCDQECVNQDPRDTGRQYVCKCRSGYSVDIDNQHKCITKVRPQTGFPCRAWTGPFTDVMYGP